jgi:hypothetical protein
MDAAAEIVDGNTEELTEKETFSVLIDDCSPEVDCCEDILDHGTLEVNVIPASSASVVKGFTGGAVTVAEGPLPVIEIWLTSLAVVITGNFADILVTGVPDVSCTSELL